MATVRQVSVSSAEQLEQSISSYIAQGFAVMNRSPNSATMFKKKEFSVLWAVVGLVLCLFPLLIYLIVYAAQSDQMVEIRVLQSRSELPPLNAKMSPDGNFWWDGGQWVGMPASEELKPPKSPGANPSEPSRPTVNSPGEPADSQP